MPYCSSSCSCNWARLLRLEIRDVSPGQLENPIHDVNQTCLKDHGYLSTLESLEILHPLQREVMWLHICFVEYKDEWKFRFV